MYTHRIRSDIRYFRSLSDFSTDRFAKLCHMQISTKKLKIHKMALRIPPTVCECRRRRRRVIETQRNVAFRSMKNAR